MNSLLHLQAFSQKLSSLPFALLVDLAVCHEHDLLLECCLDMPREGSHQVQASGMEDSLEESLLLRMAGKEERYCLCKMGSFVQDVDAEEED